MADVREDALRALAHSTRQRNDAAAGAGSRRVDDEGLGEDLGRGIEVEEARAEDAGDRVGRSVRPRTELQCFVDLLEADALPLQGLLMMRARVLGDGDEFAVAATVSDVAAVARTSMSPP